MTKHPHSFHIPVMGTGFTIDTPLKVARYGISSVISLVDDVLIEKVRKYHCQRLNEPYEPIEAGVPDSRAHRITAYLNLLDRVVRRQVTDLQASSFEGNGEIRRYYDLLPETDLKKQYRKMLAETDEKEKARLQDELRLQAVPGSIDVNIMTKLDCDTYRNGEKQPPEYSGAMSALRGYAQSTLRSAIVFSAGISQRLYGYAAQFEDFFPDKAGNFIKEIVLKVSDYRSALIQGKFLANRGLWVAEFRVESGLNCGGHAFLNPGHLLGPVLEEFKEKRRELYETQLKVYEKALSGMGRPLDQAPPQARLTVQGGIGTAGENDFLLNFYQVDSTGWGTPFLLVPEATNVDQEHLDRLIHAKKEDVYLSNSSPLGVPYWSLRTSYSEEARRRRIQEGHPGSPCPNKLLATNAEFTKIPICPASRLYVKRKLEHLPEEGLSPEQLAVVKELVLEKTCICHDLAGSATLKYGIDQDATPSVCCGPNILNFKKIASLEDMVGHIYGRLSLLANSERPNMFLEEIRLYVEQLRKEMKEFSDGLQSRQQSYLAGFKKNLLSGIEYYRGMTRQFIEDQRDRFLEELKSLQQEIEMMSLPRPAEG